MIVYNLNYKTFNLFILVYIRTHLNLIGSKLPIKMVN